MAELEIPSSVQSEEANCRSIGCGSCQFVDCVRADLVTLFNGVVKVFFCVWIVVLVLMTVMHAVLL